MKQYLDLLKDINDNGEGVKDRTGVGTRSVFGRQVRYDLSKGFPLITTKKMFWKGIVHELLWFLQGSSNIKYLVDNNIRIWDAWANSDGDLGPVYGKQWCAWDKYIPYDRTANGNYICEKKEINQIKNVVERIKTNPECRRLIVNAWNPADIEKVGLAWCHSMFQFNVKNNKLSCQMYQRSADVFLG